ncbi:MAG: type IV pilus assembly protein PilM [Elusimicrobiota bacterium]
MLGLDIGSKYIKICQIEKRAGRLYDIYSAVEKVPVSESDSNYEDALARKIKSMFKKNNFSDTEVASCISDPQILIRKLEMPMMPREELEGAVELEAQRLIYSDLSSMDTDFQILSDEESAKNKVLFVAVPEEMVNSRIRIIQKAGFEPSIIDADNLAAANYYLENEPDSADRKIMILNIGHKITNLTVLYEGNFGYSKSLSFGGDNITKEIEQEFKIPYVRAEEIKEDPAIWKESGLNIKNVLRKTTPDLLESIYRAIEYCRSKKMFRNLDKILITGGTSYLKGLDAFIQEILGVKIEVWNPLMNIEMCSEKELGQFMSSSIGMAVRK